MERSFPMESSSAAALRSAATRLPWKCGLTNGTDKPLTGLRSQVCVMLKGLIGFNSQRKRQTVANGPFIAVKADGANRWIITAWQPNNRAWDNPPVPCIHSTRSSRIATRAKPSLSVVGCGFTKATRSNPNSLESADSFDFTGDFAVCFRAIRFRAVHVVAVHALDAVSNKG